MKANSQKQRCLALQLSKMLVTGVFDKDLVKNYLELCNSTLEIELQMYANSFTASRVQLKLSS